jgi:UDP-N-acetylmuramate: L-alanyl-gamma-D-glutamyl-meso-diaminopimelate ligase
MDSSPKHIHIVGICGVATSALAIAFHNKGWKVTGSDKGFFPPVSTELEKHGISFYAGWHPEKMIEGGKLDIVVITTFAGTKNPEIKYAEENNITLKPYMEVFRDYFIRPKSIVCAGTWGKTSSSTLLSYILQEAEFDPTYMFGGISLSHNASAKLTDSEYSVFEGDEYKSSPTDNTPKFVYYKPTHLLLSAISWDHADLYPTEESYFNVFRKLISGIPKDGFVVANRDNEKVKELVQNAIWYGKSDAKYVYSDVNQTKDGLDFKINGIKIHSPMIGTFQAENITGCFAMASEIGIPTEKIVKAISNFKGLKRRLEKRLDSKVTIFDDIAHSPEKAASVLKTIRAVYQGKIITIFEPNSGGRQRESSTKYNNAFKDSTTVIIPRLTKLKVADDGSEKPFEGDELAETIKKTQPNTLYIEDDDKLVKYLIENTRDGDVIAFLGSHGFRGMIEETITSLRQQSQ